MEIKDIQYSEYIKMLTTVEIDENIEEKGKDILKNKFHLSSVLDIVEFKDEINWEYISNKNKNSYQLYLHSLNSISYLINSYIISNNSIYLKKSLEIIMSWNSYNLKNNKNNMIWYDHTVANRILNLMFFQLISKNILDYDYNLIEKLILKHIDYLMNDNNYRMNNHGIMMDKSLIVASYVYENEIWRLKALERIKENFYSSFSLKGVHLENSTFYHNYVKNMFYDIELFLNEHGISLGENIKERLKYADDYLRYITKPDKNLPQIGDSKKMELKNIEKLYSNFLDIDSGIAIIQNKDNNDEKNSLWLSFVCGYYTKTHKHLDDLSITLYYKGRDILVDSGGYGYGSSKERAYVRSAYAHSTLLVKDEVYDINKKNDIKIINFVDNDKFTLVKGVNYSYKESKLERNIIFVKPSTLIIRDVGISEDEKEISQIFNFSKESNIFKVDKQKSFIDISGLKISIEQLVNVEEVKKHKGDKTIPKAVVSEKTGNILEVSQLEYKVKGKNVELITIIKLNELSDNVDILKIENDCITVRKDNESFNIIL